MVPVRWDSKNGKIYGQKANQWLPRTGNQGRGLNAKGPQETFWRDGNCLSCDCGGGYTIVYIY